MAFSFCSLHLVAFDYWILFIQQNFVCLCHARRYHKFRSFVFFSQTFAWLMGAQKQKYIFVFRNIPYENLSRNCAPKIAQSLCLVYTTEEMYKISILLQKCGEHVEMEEQHVLLYLRVHIMHKCKPTSLGSMQTKNKNLLYLEHAFTAHNNMGKKAVVCVHCIVLHTRMHK